MVTGTKSPGWGSDGSAGWSLNAHFHPPAPSFVRSASMIFVPPVRWKVRRIGCVAGPCHGPISSIVILVSSAATTTPECFSIAVAHPAGTRRSNPNAKAAVESGIAHLLFFDCAPPPFDEHSPCQSLVAADAVEYPTQCRQSMADRAAMSKNNQEGSLEDREGITEPLALARLRC